MGDGGDRGPVLRRATFTPLTLSALGLAALGLAVLGVAVLGMPALGAAEIRNSAPDALSQGLYRLPFADGISVEVFDDFNTHRPRGRVDLFAVAGEAPYRVVAAADGQVMAIQDRYGEQQSGRAAALCHNNYVWIAHPNGEWTNYSHLARGSVTGKAALKVGDRVKSGQYIGDEDAIGCAMLKHVHFEVATPDVKSPIDAGGFLTDNEDGKRERNPRFRAVQGEVVIKGGRYRATP